MFVRRVQCILVLKKQFRIAFYVYFLKRCMDRCSRCRSAHFWNPKPMNIYIQYIYAARISSKWTRRKVIQFSSFISVFFQHWFNLPSFLYRSIRFININVWLRTHAVIIIRGIKTIIIYHELRNYSSTVGSKRICAWVQELSWRWVMVGCPTLTSIWHWVGVLAPDVWGLNNMYSQLFVSGENN